MPAQVGKKKGEGGPGGLHKTFPAPPLLPAAHGGAEAARGSAAVGGRGAGVGAAGGSVALCPVLTPPGPGRATAVASGLLPRYGLPLLTGSRRR